MEKDCKNYMNIMALKGKHDLSLSKWGPYAKKYMGISHIPDANKGLRFDLSIMPGFYRRKVNIPYVLWESDYHPWEAAPDFSYYMHRHELIWKDKLYCDISFSRIGILNNEKADCARLIRCELVNNTKNRENIVMHYLANMNFPDYCIKPDIGDLKKRVVNSLSTEEYDYIWPSLPLGIKWMSGIDYHELKYAKPRHTDGLMKDALLRGEEKGKDYTSGSALGKMFGKDKGDKAVYKYEYSHGIDDSVILMRVLSKEDAKARLVIDKKDMGGILISTNGRLDIITVETGKIKEGNHTVEIISEKNTDFIIDGFCIIKREEKDNVKFIKEKWRHVPDIINGPDKKSIILKYPDADTFYGIAWKTDDYHIRQFDGINNIDFVLQEKNNGPVKPVIKGNGKEHYTNIINQPVFLMPQSKLVLYGYACEGDLDNVNRYIKGFLNNTNPEKTYLTARKNAEYKEGIKEGSRYDFSRKRMSANTLLNVVYPIYAKKSYIRHNTPGKIWDCLYTWDSGFIGLGLLEMDLKRAVECLNTYLTEPGDKHTAFIHHGTPLPVQVYLFLEIANRTCDRRLIEYFYPRLKQYYMFLAGKYEGSTTVMEKSGLINTWDYFYNSGGWDDYPPQVYVHQNRMRKCTAPVVSTAHLIRMAKILKMAAAELGENDDIPEYEKDINKLENSLQKYSYDEESGYFSYVVHDENGEPANIMRHESGANYNMGLGGLSPLIAGILTEKQEKRAVGYLTDEKRLWSKAGLSTVDMSAPYYSKGGYWNGAVWMPHQWFFYKTFLDLGRADIAYKIAHTALEMYEKEVKTSYNCFEHFIVETKRGAGWHQFSGLSTPILSWFSSYYIPGTITCGFNILINERKHNEDKSELFFKFKYYGKKDRLINMIVVMNDNYSYNVYMDNGKVKTKELFPGTLQLDIVPDNICGEIRIQKNI